MPHQTFRLSVAADTNETPALNTAGISTCQLIRYKPDGNALLAEKTGGWTRFYGNQTVAPVRALWAWEDTESNAHLAVGTQNQTGTFHAQLSVITNGSQQNITPRSSFDDITAVVSTTSGNSIVTITDTTTTNVTNYDSVYIPVHISIGGLILFGLYACDPNGAVGTTTYTLQAHDILGNPLPAPSSSTSPTVAEFTTTNLSSLVTVTLNNHGYVAGDTYPVLVSTTVGGITFFGNYIVQSITDANNFVITGGNTATASATGFINNDKARYVYSFGVGAIPSGTGYGIGGYGRGGYGTGTAVTPATGTAISASDWTLDNWGEILVACPATVPASSTDTAFSPIYVWNPESGSPTATILPNAPPVNDGVFVAMPERQIVAWGSTVTGVPDPLLIRWCDINDFNAWIALVTNQAGSYRIPRGSRIVGAIQGPQQGLIFTDLGVWAMQYLGQPYVYSFNEIGSGCGMIAKKAAATLSGIVYWMGPSQFFMLGGDGVTPLVCPVWDVIFQNLDQNNLAKIRVAVNSRFNEIAWYYPSLSGGGEVDSYVKFNAVAGAWDFGLLARSAWVDQTVLGPPIGADPNSLYLYQHETSPDADGQVLAANFRTGWFTMQEGDLMTFVDQVWPDAKFGYYGGMANATLNITFYVADYPGQTPRVYGPFAFTEATKFFRPRFRGRLVSIELSNSDVGSWWRMGGLRYQYAEAGRY